jgi:hypothetical protein
MRWQDNTDLNLGVLAPPTTAAPGGSTVYPLAGLNTTAGGGRISFDHRGGPNGGIEICSWPANFPEGIYAAGVVYISGKQPVPATLDVFLNGQRLPINIGSGNVTTATVDAGPIDPNIASGIGFGTVRIFRDELGGSTGQSTHKPAGRGRNR